MGLALSLRLQESWVSVYVRFGISSFWLFVVAGFWILTPKKADSLHMISSVVPIRDQR